MKDIKKYLVLFMVTAGITQAASTVQANYGMRYHGGSKYVCRWVPGYWRHGSWVPRHKACWWTQGYRNQGYRGYRDRCRWVGGHWRNGFWVAPHRVCWR